MFKKTMYLSVLGIISLVLVNGGFSQALDTEAWPPDTDFSQEVHYWSADGFLSDTIPAGQGVNFADTLTIRSGGDQVTEEIEIAGKPAIKATGAYMNVSDEFFDFWPDVPVIDILVQYFANAESKSSDVGFLLGVLGNLHGEGGYSFESVTDQFEWRLFRIDNSGGWAGNDLAVDPLPGGAEYGGVNDGTIRFERVNGLIVRAIAFGPEGAFGAPEVINVTHEVEFNPDDYAIAAEWDLDKGVVDGLDLYRVTSGDQETVESDNIGPADDQRKAARPAFGDGTDAFEDTFVNWAILDEHFGPTDQPSTRVKIVAEYYDDPNLAGTVFGPEAYKTAGDQVAFFPEAQRTTLEGTGKWREAVWYVPDVKFSGVNVEPQGAVRFTFGGPVYISRLRLGVIRTSGEYEGVDPIPDAYPFDPDPYENYAELDLNAGVTDGLDLGTSGGDQEYFVDGDIGPEGDKRTGVRPALGEGADVNFDRYINFAILDEWFGPSSQPNAVIKIAVDYYDDPALAGESFGPDVYQSNVFGANEFKFLPAESHVTLEGTDTWRTAVWLIEDMNFSGVNQGPQAAARFWFSDNGAIYISRVRYAVIRPVGEKAGEDRLADLPVNTPVSDWCLY